MANLMIMTAARFEQLVKNRVAQEMLKQNSEYERELLKKQVDTAYFQSQINPHFLYNTLECIRGQALNEGVTDIAETVRALSLFFRYSISTKGDVVTVEEELANLQNYVAIQQYRFRNRFSLKVEFEGDKTELLRCQLPKLSLQPIAENAIVHGFSDITHGGTLTIRIAQLDENIMLTIADNGKGMDLQTVKALNEKIHEERRVRIEGGNLPKSGVGLRNVHYRIQLLFGDEYGLTVHSAQRIGTSVSLFMPIRRGI